MNYLAYGVVVSSSMSLPELVPAHAGEPQLHVSAVRPGLSLDDWRWIASPPRSNEDTIDGMWVAVAGHDGQHRILFDSGADFIVSTDSGLIHADDRHVDLLTLRHLLIDQVIPRVLSHTGRFVLHAGAFATPYGAVALMGGPGAGKSTLTASFGLHGTPVISDDALVLERDGDRLLAMPAYPGLRLWPEALPALGEGRDLPHVTPHSEKRRFSSAQGLRFADAPVPLRRVYLLEEAGVPAITITAIHPREGIMALLGNSYILDSSDRHWLAGHFASICAVSDLVDVRRLMYPKQFSKLPSVRDALLADLARG